MSTLDIPELSLVLMVGTSGSSKSTFAARHFLLVTGLALQTVSLVWFAVVTENGSTYGSFIVPLVLAGVGMGLTFAPSATAVLEGLPDNDFAIASSANSTIREFGVALGVALLTAVFLGNGAS